MRVTVTPLWLRTSSGLSDWKGVGETNTKKSCKRSLQQSVRFHTSKPLMENPPPKSTSQNGFACKSVCATDAPAQKSPFVLPSTARRRCIEPGGRLPSRFALRQIGQGRIGRRLMSENFYLGQTQVVFAEQLNPHEPARGETRCANHLPYRG